jgi:TRAP transporter TAXI family solute receptor
MRLIATTTMATAAIAAAFAVNAPQAEAQVAVFATNPQGSLGYRAGIAVSKTVTEKVDGLTGRPRPMGGSTTYIPIINRGEVDYGFTNALEAAQAVKGEGSFKGRPQSNLRLVGNMFPLVAGLAVPADAGVRTIHDLKKMKGMRVTSEYTSLTAIETWIRAAMANGGLDYDMDFKKVPVSGFVKGILALGEGKTDITWISLGNGAGRKVMTQMRKRGGWVHVSMDDSPAAVAKIKALAPGSIAKIGNTKIPGIKGPTNLIQFDYILFTHKDTNADTVYKIAKGLATNTKHLGASLGLFNKMKPGDFASPDYMPWHPGALKAAKELGWVK